MKLYAILAALLILWLGYWVLSHSFLIVSVLQIVVVLGIAFVALIAYLTIRYFETIRKGL